MFSENNRISGRQMYRLMTYDLLGIGTLLVPQMLAKTAVSFPYTCSNPS